MREESGRSLIEMIGVLAIGAIMTSAVFNIYHTINQRQKNLIATETLKDIVNKTKILLEYSGYNPVSIDFLKNEGALDSTKAPIGKKDWSITSSIDGDEFSINLVGLSEEECIYFATKKLDFITKIKINDYDSSESSFCMKTGDNKISLYAK